jgi:hypothetical protein
MPMMCLPYYACFKVSAHHLEVEEDLRNDIDTLPTGFVLDAFCQLCSTGFN